MMQRSIAPGWRCPKEPSREKIGVPGRHSVVPGDEPVGHLLGVVHHHSIRRLCRTFALYLGAEVPGALVIVSRPR